MSKGLYERTTAQRYTRRKKRRSGPILLLILLAVLAAAVILLTRSCDTPPVPVPTDPIPTAELQPSTAATTEPSEPETEAPETTVPTTEAIPESTEEVTEATTEPTTEPTEPPTEETTEETTEATEETTEATEETTEATEETTEATTEPKEDPKTVGQKIANRAKNQIGKPYAYGGVGPDSYDTSGLVYYCCKKAGISLPRTTDRQAKKGSEVKKDDLQPGDVVFFWTTTEGTPEYQGIYIGDGKFIAARNSEKPVSELDMNWEYFAERYLFARRYW